MRQSYFDLGPDSALGSHYQVIDFLGRGWEGEVYQIRERRTGIVRAAKLFIPRRTTGKDRLVRYARKLHKVRNCPIVVQYHHHDSAMIDGQQVDFLVSDFADGDMLSRFLTYERGGRLSEFEALHLFYAIVSGIEQIHFLGEYHGDIHSDNLMVSRRGLGFDVHLLDFYDLGRPTREKIQQDVYDLIGVLHEMIGGRTAYRRAGKHIKKIIMGRRKSLIRRRFRTAGQIRLALDNLPWSP